MRKLSLSLVLLVLSSAGLLSAQTPDTATLSGHVQDKSGALVAGAKVTASNALTGLRRSAATNARGEYTLPGLPIAGSYDVVVAKDGFATTDLTALKHITLSAGTAAKIDITLDVAAANDSVNVEGVAADTVLNEPTIGVRLSAQMIDEVPLLNRRITSLALLNAANRPAINQGDIFMNQTLFTTNGGGRRQQSFVVDGANGNDSWGRQTIFTNIPEAAVQEMTVLSNSFSAEYGGSTGSVVNIVTRSGGENLHGDVLELYRPGNLGAQYYGFGPATATSGNQIASDQLNQTAASLSGKLFRKDPTHFFIAGEFSQQRRGSLVTSLLDPGVFQGHYRDLMATLRIDRQMSAKNNAFFRSSSDGFYDTNPNGIVGGQTLPNVARTFHRRTYSNELGDTAVLSSHLVNNLRLQFQLASPITEFDPAQPSTQFAVPISGGPTFTEGSSQSALLMNRQYGVNEVLALTAGKNEFIVGGDWLLSHTGGDSKEFGGPYFLGKFTYKTCAQTGDTLAQLEVYCESQAYLGNIANVATYTQGYGNPNYTITDNLYAVFAQDNYHVARNFVLNLGMRYERQTFTDATENFAPRVGFVADPFSNGKTVLRGGFGIYYSQITDNSQASYVLSGPAYVNYTASPGQLGFPTSIASAPLPAIPVGAPVPVRQIYIRPGNNAYLNQYFATSALAGYPSKLLNPYSEQYTVGIEQRLDKSTVLDIDYVGTHTVHINRPLDVDAPASFVRTAQGQTRTTQAADCTRPLWIAFYQQNGTSCVTSATGVTPITYNSVTPAFDTIQSDVNNGWLLYSALDVNVKRSFGSRGNLLLSYVWSHAIDNVDPDTTSQNPNDANLSNIQERGNAIFDQRNRFVASGYYVAPLKIQVGGIITLAGGLPYNITTGTINSGDTSGSTDRPVINGVVLGRNTGRGTPIYSFDPFLARDFKLVGPFHIDLRAEAFNALNHNNFVGFIGTYGNGAAAPATLGQPSGGGLTAQLPPRQLQFSARIRF
jgi:hypothetical protein